MGSVPCGEEESGISKSERNVHELLGMVALESLGKGDRELQCWGNGKMNRGRNGGCWYGGGGGGCVLRDPSKASPSLSVSDISLR